MEGLTIVNDYISREEEQELLAIIKPSRFTVGVDRNSIRRYGSKLPYSASNIQAVIPSIYNSLCQRIYKDGYMESPPDSVTVNEYKKGQQISYHIDSPTSGPVIVVLSLLGDAIMGMKKKVEILVPVPARTLVVMKGEARWEWKHCIKPVPSGRFSIVFRKGTKNG